MLMLVDRLNRGRFIAGSLIMLYGLYVSSTDGVGSWQLVANSKNGTNNEFSIAAEHYFRAQFKAVFGDDGIRKIDEFAAFLGENSFTFCFEFVTSFLGDHGARPRMPYAVLTSITQFNEQSLESRFASLPEMVSLACVYKLILNEMWVVAPETAVTVSEELRSMRWTGEDKDFTAYLDSRAVFKVHSVLPHAVGQGQLLEGLVVQVCRTARDVLGGLQDQSASMLVHQDRLVEALKKFDELVSAASGSLLSFCPPAASGPIANATAFFGEHTDQSTPIGQLFGHLRDLGAQSRFVSLKHIQRGNNLSVILHVHQDEIFFSYARNKPSGASNLYRGMEVFLQRTVPISSTSYITYTPPSHLWEIRGISKWKNWQYLKRTFGMRNTLSALFRSGHDAFMTQVLRQFQNWGLPRQFHESNRELLSAWGKWVLDQDGCKKKFMTDSNHFGYLSYVEAFLPLYESGALGGLLMDDSERKCTMLFILCFEADRPAWLSEMTQGYHVKESYKPSKTNPYRPGVAYYLNGRLPKEEFCRSPYFVVVVPPCDTCIDRKWLGMYDSFLYQVSEMNPYPAMSQIDSELQLAELKENLSAFELAHQPKRVFLLAFVGLPPGSGKSTLANALCKALQSNGVLHSSVVSSDYYGMIYGPGTGAAREAFETAVVEALCSGSDVVIFDKNVPNMQGYEAMRSIAARAALPKLTIVPVVPKSLTESDFDEFLQRVLSREPGSHTLTADSKIPSFETVADFVSQIFGKPSIDFVPVAQLLPGAIVLDAMFVHGTAEQNASFLVDQLVYWDSHKSQSTGMNLSAGDYLGLCFELDLASKEYLQELLGVGVRELLHATIVYYRGNTARMADAARLLQTIDPKVPVVVCMTRVGMVRSTTGTLAWASLKIPGFEGEPMHATLTATGFSAFHARDSEIAYESGKVIINEESLVIQPYEIPSMNFEAWWSVC